MLIYDNFDLIPKLGKIMHCEICFDMERTTELLVLWAFVILNGFTLMCVVIVHYASEAQEVCQLSSFQAVCFSLTSPHQTHYHPPPPTVRRERAKKSYIKACHPMASFNEDGVFRQRGF